MVEIGKRGQVSVEYLIVIGFVVFLILGILTASFYYTTSINDQIKGSQLSSFANKIVGSAESVYFSGDPSKVTITAYLPEGINDIYLQDNNLVFDYSFSGGGQSITAFNSEVPIDSISGLAPGGGISTNKGLKRIEIIAGQSGVAIIEG